jgi:hypothetical protein
MGYTEVARTTSSGAHWDGGLLASFSTQGQVNWIRTYDESQWSDQFFDCQLTNGVLYAGGVYGAYQKDDQLFGYGWLAGVDPQTGDIGSSITLGDNHWYSRFNCFHVDGQSAWGGGYTEWSHENGSYNYWSVYFDLDGNPPSPAMEARTPLESENSGFLESPPPNIHGADARGGTDGW